MTSPTIPLGTIAHARAGDKGNTSILVLAPYAEHDFSMLCELITPAIVARHFGCPTQDVSVAASPHLGAFTIVVRNRLAGGVTRSPTIDPHGKSLSSHLLELEITRDS